MDYGLEESIVFRAKIEDVSFKLGRYFESCILNLVFCFIIYVRSFLSET